MNFGDVMSTCSRNVPFAMVILQLNSLKQFYTCDSKSRLRSDAVIETPTLNVEPSTEPQHVNSEADLASAVSETDTATSSGTTVSLRLHVLTQAKFEILRIITDQVVDVYVCVGSFCITTSSLVEGNVSLFISCCALLCHALHSSPAVCRPLYVTIVLCLIFCI